MIQNDSALADRTADQQRVDNPNAVIKFEGGIITGGSFDVFGSSVLIDGMTTSLWLRAMLPAEKTSR